MTQLTRIQLRRGTEANLLLSTTTFVVGELAYATDTKQLYISDGTNKLRVVTCDSVGGAVINENGADADVRIKGVTATNLVLVDASLDAFQIGTTTAGVIADFRSAAIVFNENGADRDTRIEGDTDDKLVFVDASTDRIGVGKTPAVKFDVEGVIGAKAGLSSSVAKVGGVIFDHYTTVGNVGGGEDELYSDTTAASTLGANGDKIVAKYAGQMVSGGVLNQVRLRAYFAGTLIYDSGAVNPNVDEDWELTVTIIRESSTVVRCVSAIHFITAETANYCKYTRVTGLTLSNTNILKLTGTSTTLVPLNDEITVTMGTVSWQPAA